jgi:hypothetical protein
LSSKPERPREKPPGAVSFFGDVPTELQRFDRFGATQHHTASASRRVPASLAARKQAQKGAQRIANMTAKLLAATESDDADGFRP